VKVTQSIIDQLNTESLLKEHQDAAIVQELSVLTGETASEAMRHYYRSNMAQRIACGEYGIQYLDASVLARMLLEENSEKATPSAP